VQLLKLFCFTLVNIELIVIAGMVWCITVPPKDD
jgi:hypothetical protein